MKNLRKIFRIQSYLQVLTSTAGQAHVLNHFAEAESEAELKLFADAIRYIREPKLKKLAEIHQQDEIQHVELFQSILLQLGAERRRLPSEMSFVKLIDDSQSIQSRGVIENERDLFEFYSGILRIEERTIFELSCVVEVAKRLKLRWAEKIDEVIKDEQRHVGYCHRVMEQISLPQAEKFKIQEHYRALERRAFIKLNQMDIDFVHRMKIVQIPRISIFIYKKALQLLA